MPFHIVRNDITNLQVDAVVNAANPRLLGGGGVDGAIHRAAGPELAAYCRTLGGCPVGQVRLTPGFRLKSPWILHTVGPVWQGGDRGEEALLSACYRNCLALALERGFGSVAFPLISAGAYGCPGDLALSVAVREIGSFLLEHEMEVTLVVYDEDSFRRSSRLFAEVRSYLDSYPPLGSDSLPRNRQEERAWAMASMQAAAPQAAMPAAPAAKPSRKKFALPALPRKPKAAKSGAAPTMPAAAPAEQSFAGAVPPELDQRLQTLDESFSQMLLRKIDEKGITDAACYKRANVDRKLFSKIRSDPKYRPSKPTAIAFAIALELPLPETRELLMKAGFALSPSSKFDVIIEYFIGRGNYNIFEINETLFAFDQNLLGA